MEFMIRIKSERFNLFMCHFDIDTPEKMNQVMESFKKLPDIYTNHGDREYYDDESSEAHGGPSNSLVEFLSDSFCTPQTLSWLLKYFKINDLETLKELIPYGYRGNKLHTRNSKISLEKTQTIFELFGIATLTQYVHLLECMRKVGSEHAGKYDKIELLYNHEI